MTVILTQQFSVDEQVPENLPPEMQRLEQTRMRVLETTRAYLGTNFQLRVNTQERRGDVSESQVCQSQGRTGVEGSSTQVPQKSDPKSRTRENEAGTNDDGVLRDWLAPEAL
ncbi:uncharacterized protein A1O5_05558 [Cladophialophora psammophila CBS 110553]|uniref:Uncharacterized protein n=1 Tax=Cladophialophora psammophila CBS 110553 TaxID=1182543 RepID=W9WUV5_9EURO|nr:uncharacterized protein A1O5_05558 [Cladophialophora psammophila CBS 110553]EXJ71748.1 hypothetical protein A1O5_05558 [Cladophialophora psammophila CBS 110553]